jgi:cytochrome c553
LYKQSKKFPLPSAWLLANSCAGCHGTNGAEFDTSIPPLAGMNKDAFVDMMKAYKSEKIVKSSVMTMVAKQLNDKEITLMADFFAKQKATQWSARKWSKNDK